MFFITNFVYASRILPSHQAIFHPHSTEMVVLHTVLCKDLGPPILHNIKKTQEFQIKNSFYRRKQQIFSVTSPCSMFWVQDRFNVDDANGS